MSLVVAGWIKRRAETLPLLLSNCAGALLIASLVSGELAAASGFPWSLMAIRVASAVLLWTALTALIVREGLKVSAVAGQKAQRASPYGALP